MIKNLFISNSYVKVIKSYIGENNLRWGIISEMAAASGSQQSHFSRVIKGKVHLTLEQAAGLCEYFRLSEVESEYFLNLVMLARAGTPALKQKIERRLSTIRNEQEDLSRRLKSAPIGAEEKEIVYYSAWYWSAIHVLVSIPQFQTVAAISRKLALPEELVKFCLTQLEKFDLVNHKNHVWQTTKTPVHLSKKSALIGTHHNNWRNRAVLDAQSPLSDSLHYTVVQSVSHNDFVKIKQMLIATIESYASVANPSHEEDLATLCIDWFRV